MKILSFKLPDALDRKLTSVVRRRRVQKSSIVREALARYLDEAPESRAGSLIDAAGDLVGCVKDAPRDLASNRRHLDDFGR